MEDNKTSSAGAKVTVACKLPQGLVLRGFSPTIERESVMGGGSREMTIHRPDGRRVVIHGTAHFPNQRPECSIVAGYALTKNVDKDLWDMWYAANKSAPYVVNRSVFAFEKQDSVYAEARNSEKIPSGFEGIDPMNPGARLRGIEKGERAA